MNFCKKRLFDILIIILSAPLILAVFLCLYIVSKIHDPFSSVLYSQYRIGKNGLHYKIWKFRTMVPNSDTMKPEDFLKTEEEIIKWNKYQKIDKDPRITKIGRFLRKSSLDEIPQLWNVFIGDMSLVGPRPILPDQINSYKGAHYFCMKPGLTGLWQISGRNDTSFSNRARYDDLYWKKSSIITDTFIIWKTFFVVFQMTGK